MIPGYHPSTFGNLLMYSVTPSLIIIGIVIAWICVRKNFSLRQCLLINSCAYLVLVFLRFYFWFEFPYTDYGYNLLTVIGISVAYIIFGTVICLTSYFLIRKIKLISKV